MSPPSDAPPVVASDARIPARLRDALLAADADVRASFDALRDAVCAHVEDRRRGGVPLDETVAEVKALVAGLRGEHALVPAGAGPDALVEQLVAWCTESYG
jgi:hypothetical protein